MTEDLIPFLSATGSKRVGHYVSRQMGCEPSNKIEHKLAQKRALTTSDVRNATRKQVARIPRN